jgi:hypothetical protein
LKSGKNLSYNIAHQFLNSIFSKTGRKEGEEEIFFTLKDKYSNDKKSIERKSYSRSRSHSRPNRDTGINKFKLKTIILSITRMKVLI